MFKGLDLHESKRQITTEDGSWIVDKGTYITKEQDEFVKCIERAKYQPKVLLYPRTLVDKLGVDETIDWILKTFDIKMHVIYSDDHQYLFEEVQRA
jgi:hypothetical protein